MPILRSSLQTLLFTAAIALGASCAPDPVPTDDAGAADAGDDDDDDDAGTGASVDAGPVDPDEGPTDVRLPTDLPEGTELIDLGLLPMGGGRSADISLAIGTDVYSFMVLAYAVDGVSVILERVLGPDGTLVVDDLPPADANAQQIAVARGFPGPFLSQNRIIPSRTSGAFLVPNSPEVPFIPGTYKLRVGSYAITPTQSGFDVEPRESPVHIAILVRRAVARPTAGTVDLTLWFSGSNDVTAASAQEDSALQSALALMRTAYAAVGVDVGDVKYVDLPDASLRTIILAPDICEGGDMDTLFQSSDGAADNRLNLFFVERFQCIIGGAFDMGQAIGGIAGGIPGLPYAQGTPHSGVAVSTAFLADEPATAAVVMAHETGHFLGLYHTQENDMFGGGPIYDGIGDTPDDSGAEANLMYFSAGTDTTLSTGQGFVMNANPWVKP